MTGLEANRKGYWFILPSSLLMETVSNNIKYTMHFFELFIIMRTKDFVFLTAKLNSCYLEEYKAKCIYLVLVLVIGVIVQLNREKSFNKLKG